MYTENREIKNYWHWAETYPEYQIMNGKYSLPMDDNSNILMNLDIFATKNIFPLGIWYSGSASAQWSIIFPSFSSLDLKNGQIMMNT